MAIADYLTGSGGTLDALVRWRASDSSAKAFAEMGTRRTTFAELDDMADRVAAGLGDLGVRRGDAVAIAMANSFEFLYSLFGCLRLGAVYVPCSTHFTPDELAYQLDHSGVVAVITDAPRSDVVAAAVADAPGVRHVIAVDASPRAPWHRFESLTARSAAGVPSTPSPAADDPALVIYTSGTTSRPKGILFTHGNLVAATENVVNAYGWSADDRALHYFPMFHVNGGVVSLMPAVAVGATIVMIDRFSASAFGPQLHDLDITYCNVNATNVKMVLAAAPTPFDADHRARRMLLGLSLEDADRVEFERRFNTRLCPTYGMTETLGVVTSERPTEPRRPGSAGRALRGYEVEARNPEGDPLAPGEIGEIWVRSVQRHGLATRYLADDEATSRSFVEGWLRTGDLGSVDVDGYLVYAGRLHDVIKRSGYNVAPAEVERVIAEVPGVVEVAVVGAPDPIREEAIVAYVAASSDDVSVAEILTVCRAKLASYKLPQAVRIVDSLPLTFIGKIDRAALRARARQEDLTDGQL